MRPNDVEGMRRVITHLMERGCSSVAYVAGSTRPSSTVRYDALRTAMKDLSGAGMTIERDFLDGQPSPHPAV